MNFKNSVTIKIMPFFFCLLVVSQLMFFGPRIASADLLSDQEGLTTEIPQAFNSAGGAPLDIRVVVARVISVFLGLLGIMFLALIVLAGYKWMMAQGDSSKIEEAKDQLRTSVIGLAIILAAWGLTVFVFNSIIKAADPSYSIWGI
jgi:hypothetical protein